MGAADRLKLAAQAKAKDDALRPWLARASAQITRRLTDARIHAEAGRKDDALARLDELDELLRSRLSAARASFYRAAFAHHRPLLDPEIHRLDLGPHPEAEKVASSAPIGGRDQHADLVDVIDEARAGIRSILAIGGDRPARLRSWESAHSVEITRQIHGSLSNAQIALFEAVGKLLEK